MAGRSIKLSKLWSSQAEEADPVRVSQDDGTTHVKVVRDITDSELTSLLNHRNPKIQMCFTEILSKEQEQ